MDLKKINWKQPKYLIPAMALIPLLFIGYQVCGMITFEAEEDEKVVVFDVNTDLPEINDEKTTIKNKYESMLDGFGKVTEYTAVENTEKEEKENLVYDGFYTEEEKVRIDSIRAMEEQQKKQAEELNKLIESQRREMAATRQQQNVISRQAAQNDERIKDNEELDAFAKKMQLIQQATSGQPILTEEEKQEQKRRELLAMEQKRLQDSIALANAPSTVTKASQGGDNYFNTVSENVENPNLIRARVDEWVKVKEGSRLRIRLDEDVNIEGEILKKGTYLYAMISGFSGQRVMGKITSVMVGKSIKKVDLNIYDLDCMEGFYVPVSNFRDLAKNIAGDAMNMNMNISGSSGNQNLESMAMQTLQQTMTALTSGIGQNIRQNKAKIKFNTEIYLIDGSSK